MPGPHFNSKRLREAQRVHSQFAPGSVPRIGKRLFTLRLLPRTTEQNCGCQTFDVVQDDGTGTGTWTVLATITGDAGSDFGDTVVISDNGAVIVTIGGENVASTNPGKLWIHRLNGAGTGYTLDHTIDGSTAAQIGRYQTGGLDISNDGNTVIYGVKDNNTAADSSIKVLKYVGGNWTLDTTIVTGYVGFTCCINGNGNRVAIADGYYTSGVQKIYIYSLTGGGHTLLGSAIDLKSLGYNMVGHTLAMNKTGDHIYIGTSSVIALIYKYTTNWVQKGTSISITGSLNFGQFGDIDDSGDRVVLSGNRADGAIYIYDYTTDWNLSQTISGATGSGEGLAYHGANINGAGDKIVAGALFGGTGQNGYVISYKLDNGSWIVDMEKQYGDNAADRFGIGYHISKVGNYIIGSSKDYNSDQGQVKVFKLG